MTFSVVRRLESGGSVTNRQVYPTGKNFMSEIVGKLLGQLDLQLRKQRHSDRKKRGDQEGIGVRRPADVKNHVGILIRRAPALDGSFDVKNPKARILDELPSGLRQFDHLVIAVEEQIAKLSFKLINSPAECGLVDVQPLRDSGEVQFFG